MKRNLLQGIILIGAVALSSCSVNNKLASTDDDVYNTKAKAGDQLLYADNINNQNQQNSYNADDDYYYYGDYASRINRFSYFTPFDYDDDFYYNYAGYNTAVVNSAVSSYDNSYMPDYNFADIYSPYDYGYYDFGGYDDWGYGSSYSFNLFSGGGVGRRHHVRQYSRATSIGGGFGPAFTRSNGGRSGITRGGTSAAYPGRQNTTAVYPGRPNVNSPSPRNTNAVRAVRPERQDVRPAQPVFTPSQAPSFSSPGNSGGGGASSNGGGGRPVRP